MAALTVPFGISSYTRNLPDMNGEPFIVARAAGARLFDSKGNAYVDYALGMGADFLGHAHPLVVEACIEALRNGSMPGFRHEGEERAARALARVGGERITRVTFTSTGSEAVHLACRLARHITGRPLVAKSVGGYDGWFDDMLFGLVDSPEAERSPQRPVRNCVTLSRINDFEDLALLFQQHGRDLAAVIVEPILGTGGSLVPTRAYLQRLTELAQRNGTLVIADEVLVGLRLGYKLVSEVLGLTPDLVVMGKAIGSGLPVAALVGTPQTFEPFDQNRLARLGTYQGNPVVTAAVSATAQVLSSADYSKLFAYGAELRRSIVTSFAEHGIAVSTSGVDSLFSLWFAARPPQTYDEAKAAVRRDASRETFEILRRHQVITLPSPWSRLFISFAHGAEELQITRDAYRAAAKQLAEGLLLKMKQ